MGMLAIIALRVFSVFILSMFDISVYLFDISVYLFDTSVYLFDTSVYLFDI